MTNIINQNTFEKFKTIRNDYVAYMKTLNDAFIKQVIQELKVKYGDFAIVVRGYTPTWNDGDICEHSYDYSLITTPNKWGFDNDDLYIYDRFDGDDVYTELFEYDEENKTTINTCYVNNQSFEEDITNFTSFIDDVNDTNYEVRVKYKDGVVSCVSEYCDPDY